MKQITLKHLLINGQKQIGLQFYPDKVIQAMVKQLPSPKWHSGFQVVYLPNTKENLNLIFNTFRGVAWVNCKHFFGNASGRQPEKIDMAPLKANNQSSKKRCPLEYIEKLERNHYAKNTAESYISHFERFLNHFPILEPTQITEIEINQYLTFLTKKQYSKSSINISINAIKFYYDVVLGMPNRFYNVDRPRKDHQLPEVLSKSDVLAIIEV